MATAGILLLVEPSAGAFAAEARASLEAAGRTVLVPAVTAEDWGADRRAIREIGARADEWRAGGSVDTERLAVVGFGRGGTLAFLMGCAQRFAAVVDVDGPVLYAELGAEHPTQPLELGLNLEGAFLGSFGRENGAVDDAQCDLLHARLTAAARPFEILRHAGAGDPGAWRAAGLLERVSAFVDAAD